MLAVRKWEELPAKLRRAFDYALKKTTDPRPTGASCEQLAWRIQTIVNGVKSPADVEWELLRRFKDAADQTLIAARAIADHKGGGHDFGAITLEEVQQVLERTGTAGFPTKSPPARLGRRPEYWHENGRAIAHEIAAVLRRAGNRRRLRSTDIESPVAIVGAAVVSWAYGIPLKPAGFASAMKTRDRSKAKSPRGREEHFYDSFPAARRIIVLD
jgi:hypothetical protein